MLALGLNLTAIASIGSAVALLIFMLVTIAHLRVWEETGVRTSILVLAVTTADIAFLSFVFTILIDEPASAAMLLAILLLSVALDFGWKHIRTGRTNCQSAETGHPIAGDAQSAGGLNYASTPGVRYVNRSGRRTDDGG